MDPEAVLLLSYVMTGSGHRWTPDLAAQQRYVEAVKTQVPPGHRLDAHVFRHPVLLGGLDAVSRVLYPRSILQQKLIVAAALVECHPDSADWLLPRNRGMLSLGAVVAVIAVRILAKLCVGVPMLFFRQFLRRNVGPA